jgi:hypothetical protein
VAIYSDLNSVTPTTTRSLILVDAEAVYQWLYNLFNTEVGEVPFSDFGFILPDQVWELITTDSALLVYDAVVTSVTRWITQVQVDTALTTVTPLPDINTYDCDLVFDLQGVDNSGRKFTYQGSFTQ